MGGFAILVFLCYIIFSTSIPSTTPTDTITPNQTTGVNDTVVSAGGYTELGFFTPSGKPNQWYLGIWYKKISPKTIIWVANREIPLTDSLGFLQLTQEGNLHVVNSRGSIIWSSNGSRPVQNPVAQLLYTGNLVVREVNDTYPENFSWESFDYPTDTFLAGMKLGRNLKSGLDRYLTSWRSTEDPAPGNFTYRLETSGYPQLILRSGDAVRFRSGPWNGLLFSGLPMQFPNPVYRFWFEFNKEEVHFQFEPVNVSVVARLVLNPSGLTQQFACVDRTQGWVLYSSAITDNCDNYALCGVYGSCRIDRFDRSPTCWCLNGFKPKFPQDWDKANWSHGCVRRVQLDCLGDGFVQHSGVKLPDTRGSWFSATMSLDNCQRECLQKCNCTAYTSLDIRARGGGTGCLLWFGDLIDIRQYNENGQDLYIQVAASELVYLDTKAGSTAKKKEKVIISASVVTAGMLLVGFSLILWNSKRKQRQKGKDLLSFDLGTSIGAGNNTLNEANKSQNTRKKEIDLPRFSFASVSAATDDFSDANKLGEGGFGPVYKGTLQRGYNVAVKRLSRKSGQGLEELQNEATLIAKLQHKNLVRLLGWCIERDEKILIYEYMPNKSLDFFLFDPFIHGILNWEVRLKIIQGIAQGLLYLHQYSRIQIIHRDLKASNILLDKDMNPKISDFGMAKIFGGNGSQATERIVGTYGYMSPEYALEGLFSVKSDVFSFGVLLLEILSGKRNTGFYHTNSLNLLGYTWDLWKSGRGQDVKDPTLEDISSTNILLRYINIGLLCVQEIAADRPTMSDVVSMLSNELALVPSPKQPAFSTSRSVQDSHKHPECVSENDVTISILEAR